ncbi:MAG TPA: sulfite exporter TauE/SafE family protein [Opitutaceae bacterium]|nr:sulfite exporter TauE/SafE family protein [Opitutaceae bacterium]HND60977.1 sulfite exporter TauE/SafE family protein [Opitutaceae bacterium]
MTHLEPWQWALAVVGALAIGLAKTGINGLGMLAVVVFANLLPARQASGVVLPMLVLADVVAVASYRQHTVWSHLWRLFPWTAAGIVAGYFALGRINDRQASVLIGVIILGMLGMHLWRRRRPAAAEAEHPAWFAPTIGVLAGFTTLVANAAGPLMAIYLLAMRLPKMEYMGTGATFYLLMNLFKVPFMAHLGLVSASSLGLNAVLAPAVLVGALLGRKVLARIDQKLFEQLALGLAALAGLKLLF